MARKSGPDSIGLPGCAVPTHSGQHRQNSQMPVASTIGPCAPASVDQVSLPSDSNVGRAMTAMPANPNHSSEEHTSELQSLMRISYAVFCLKKNNSSQSVTQKQ